MAAILSVSIVILAGILNSFSDGQDIQGTHTR